MGSAERKRFLNHGPFLASETLFFPPLFGILLFQSYCKTECICRGMAYRFQCHLFKYSHSIRTEYDHGVSTYSPEGRLFQVEYAIESIKVGFCFVFVII